MMADADNTPEKSSAGDFEPKNFLNSFFQIAKAVLLSPKAFYEGMNTEGGLRNPFIFLVCCVVIHTAIASLFVTNQPVVFFNVVYGILMPFVTAGVLFFILTRFFKAAGTFEAAFRVNAYAAATALLSWIPVAFRTEGSASPGTLFSLIALTGLFIEFYRLYLIAIGLSRTFSVTVSRAALAIVITAFIYILTLGPLVKFMFAPEQPGSPPSGETHSPETSMIDDRPQLVVEAAHPRTCDLKT
jgi:hypothetical protein